MTTFAKTLDTAGVMVALNGKAPNHVQHVEDLVDAVGVLEATADDLTGTADSVTGARDDGTALASLLTVLEAKGLITDDTTAS